MSRSIAVGMAVAVVGVSVQTPASAADMVSLRGKQVIARFDVNKDGKIDSKERVASKLELHQKFLVAEAARKRAEMLSKASGQFGGAQQFGGYGGNGQFGGFQQFGGYGGFSQYGGFQSFGGYGPMTPYPSTRHCCDEKHRDKNGKDCERCKK